MAVPFAVRKGHWFYQECPTPSVPTLSRAAGEQTVNRQLVKCGHRGHPRLFFKQPGMSPMPRLAWKASSASASLPSTPRQASNTIGPCRETRAWKAAPSPRFLNCARRSWSGAIPTSWRPATWWISWRIGLARLLPIMEFPCECMQLSSYIERSRAARGRLFCGRRNAMRRRARRVTSPFLSMMRTSVRLPRGGRLRSLGGSGSPQWRFIVFPWEGRNGPGARIVFNSS